MSIENVWGTFNENYLFATILGVSFIVFVVCAIIFYFSFKNTVLSANSKSSDAPAHIQHANKQAWRKDIDEIVQKYHKNELTSDQACAKLAKIARIYVSIMSGEDIHTHTLGEISSLRLKWRNKKGADMLRQTIAALYPPEFADLNKNEQAKNTTVEQAAEWVLVLLEGWQTKGQR